MEHAVVAAQLSATGNLSSIHSEIIAAGKFCCDTQFQKRILNGTQKMAKVQRARILLRNQKGKIQISQVMINCSSTGHAAHNRKLKTSYQLLIDLLNGVLVPPNDNGWRITPKKKPSRLILGQRIEKMLLKR